MQGSCCFVSHHPKVVRSSFFWLYTLRGSIFEPLGPFQRAAEAEPCAKKAKTTSALDLPHGICEELTASLRIALWQGERPKPSQPPGHLPPTAHRPRATGHRPPKPATRPPATSHRSRKQKLDRLLLICHSHNLW